MPIKGRLNMLVEVGAEPHEDVAGKIAMIERGTCGFFTKVSAAMHAGARAVLVTDAADSSGTIEMGCGEPDPCGTSPLAIPAAMISYAQAQKLLALRDRWGTAGTTITLNARYEGEHFVGACLHLHICLGAYRQTDRRTSRQTSVSVCVCVDMSTYLWSRVVYMIYLHTFRAGP